MMSQSDKSAEDDAISLGSEDSSDDDADDDDYVPPEQRGIKKKRSKKPRKPKQPDLVVVATDRVHIRLRAGLPLPEQAQLGEATRVQGPADARLRQRHGARPL